MNNTKRPARTDKQQPTAFRLDQNIPNPFSTSTTIRFALPEACYVRLTIYNRDHELISILHDGFLAARHYNMEWRGIAADGQRVPDGFYKFRLEANGFVATRKLEINSKL